MTEISNGSYDFRLENDSSMLVSGPSKCGKTTFVIELLKHRHRLFRDPVNTMWWFYGVDSPEVHRTLQAMGVRLVEGTPAQEHMDQVGKGDIIVIDDLQQESEGNKDITNWFIKGCHHKKFFVIKLTQYLFGNREQCIQNSNTHYYVIFYNPRNQQQTIQFLSRMFPPGNRSMLARILEDVHRNKYGYLFVDYTSNCDAPRLRTDIFGDFVVFKLKRLGHGNTMDYSRIALNPNQSGGGHYDRQTAVDRQVQRFISPQYGQMEQVARRLVTAPLVRTADQARERVRRLESFNRFRQRFLGLTPSKEKTKKDFSSTPLETPVGFLSKASSLFASPALTSTPAPTRIPIPIEPKGAKRLSTFDSGRYSFSSSSSSKKKGSIGKRTHVSFKNY